MFSKRDNKRIARVVSETEKRLMSSRARSLTRPETNRASVLVKTPSGGIPARSGTTLGKATCTVQVIDKSTDGISDGQTISVYNPSTAAIAGSTYISAIRERTGVFVADVSGESTQIDSAWFRVSQTSTAISGTFDNEFSLVEASTGSSISLNAVDEIRLGASGQYGYFCHVQMEMVVNRYGTSNPMPVSGGAYVYPHSEVLYTLKFICDTTDTRLFRGVDKVARQSVGGTTERCEASASISGVMGSAGSSNLTSTLDIGDNSGGSASTIFGGEWILRGDLFVERIQ